MNRKSQIEAILTKAEAQLRSIVSEYESSLHKQQVDASLQVDIKNYCENLRSVLDYLAHEIREKHCQAADPNARFYFPILSKQKEFNSQTERWFPGLKSSAPDVWSKLEGFQPFQSGQEWLGHLNKVNNENKHGALVAQKRQEVATRIQADIQGGSSVSWDPNAVKFGSGVHIGGVPVNPSTQMPQPDSRLKVTKTVWVDFQFDGVGVSAIELLKKSLEGVKSIEAALRPHLRANNRFESGLGDAARPSAPQAGR